MNKSNTASSVALQCLLVAVVLMGAAVHKKYTLKMNKSNTASSVALQCLLVAVVLMGAAVHGTSAVTCSPLELSPCIGAITGPSQSPSAACCAKLREQIPCLCGYLKNPNLRPYVGSPNARKVAATCRVATPTC